MSSGVLDVCRKGLKNHRLQPKGFCCNKLRLQQAIQHPPCLENSK